MSFTLGASPKVTARAFQTHNVGQGSRVLVLSEFGLSERGAHVDVLDKASGSSRNTGATVMLLRVLVATR